MFARLFKYRLPTDKKALGKWGQKRCEKFLKNKGLRTLAKNFACKTGEIDLIMLDRDATVVFIEVKTRADENFTAAEDVITLAKKNRMKKTARFFLAAHKINDRPLRFDVVTIVLDKDSSEQIRHYQNAFS
jgi:putative endonuclease